MNEHIAIRRAIDLMGGVYPAAARMGVSPQAVYKWLKQGRAPVVRVLEIERAAGVRRWELRPDIYPREAA